MVSLTAIEVMNDSGLTTQQSRQGRVRERLCSSELVASLGWVVGYGQGTLEG